ncbi:hypothetical protein FBU31_003985 [Coemansia sp. 'formosensis']|nr:hypothetical protein FBU31_003985 [Coemansia sp. 'formosensis']
MGSALDFLQRIPPSVSLLDFQSCVFKTHYAFAVVCPEADCAASSGTLNATADSSFSFSFSLSSCTDLFPAATAPGTTLDVSAIAPATPVTTPDVPTTTPATAVLAPATASPSAVTPATPTTAAPAPAAPVPTSATPTTRPGPQVQ